MSVLAKDVKRKGQLRKGCKLCDLVEVDSALWVEVHRKVLEEGLARSKVCKWLNSKLEILNIDLPDDSKVKNFNDENFARHFHNHIPEYERVKILLRDKALGKDRDNSNGFSAESISVVETFMEEHLEDYSDYTSINRMISTLEEHLVSYNNYLIQKTRTNSDTPGRKPIILSELTEYKGLVESLTDLKLKVAKIRTSSVVSGAAVRRAISLSVKLFLDHVTVSTEEAKQALNEGMPGSNLPEEVINKVRHHVANSVKSSLPDIVETIFKEFGIK